MVSFLKNPYRELEKSLGYRFRSKNLLLQALTHSSFRHEQSLEQNTAPDNQRMEFLGDAALGLAAAESLYLRHPDLDEGQLTRMRASITNARALAEIAAGIGLGAHLRLGRGELSSGGRDRPSNLADALEAILGAALLDGGQKAVGKIFEHVFLQLLDAPSPDSRPHNPKGALQEWTQEYAHLAPVYRLAEETGPAHSPEFHIEVLLRDRLICRGHGRSKREAEMDAARRALTLLKEEAALPPSA
jgi:ribonuclease-3